MRGFLGYMQKRGLGKRSIARTLSAIRTFYRYLANENDIDANPAKMVGTPKSDRYLPSYLDRAQIEQVIVSALYVAHAAGSALDTHLLMQAIRDTRPLSVVMAEQVQALRAWALPRTVPAD